MIREQIILNNIINKNVLDIGSIGQTDEYSLWNLYKTVKIESLTGIDLSDAHKTISDFKFSKKVESDAKTDDCIVFGNMESYKFDRKFDVVIAGDVLEHVSNQGLFLDNIHNHLNQTGKLIITTPNAKWFTVFLKPNLTHTLWHDSFTLQRILDMHNFKITFFKYYYGNKKKYNWFKRILTLKQSIIVICEKK